MVWIASPAGSGKTTLVSAWLTASKSPHLWYDLDAGDNDPATFFHYLSLAAAAAYPRRKITLPHLTPEYLFDLPTFTRRFFEQMCERLAPPANRAKGAAPGRFIIVFDNYHDLPVQAPLHTLLPQAIEALPDNFVLLVISRHEPPPTFARLKANQQIGLLSWEALRFTEEEVAALVETETATTGATACVLHQQTDGWAAGLRLLLASKEHVSPDSQGQPTACPTTPAWHDDVFAYFASEVMNCIEPGLREFLLTTALLPTVTPSIAARLTGREDAAQVLGGLNKRHYFTLRHPGPVPQYRYHPLFREFLQTQAAAAFSADELRERRRRGAELLAEAGDLEAAVELFSTIGAFEQEAALLHQIAWPLLAQGRSQTVWQWLSAIPRERLAADAALLLLAGTCRLLSNTSEARALLEQAANAFEQQGEHAGAVRALGSCLEALAIEGSSYERVDDYVARLDALMQQDATAAAEVAGAVLLALAFRNLNHPSVPFWRETAELAVTQARDPAARLYLANYLMAYYMFRGEYTAMHRIMQLLAVQRSTAQDEPTVLVLTRMIESYYAGYVKGDMWTGIALARQGLALGREKGIAVYDFWFNYLLIHLEVFLGNVAEADTLLAPLLAQAAYLPAVRQADLFLLAGQAAMARDDWSTAAEWCRRATELFDRSGARYSASGSRVVLAYALHVLGERTAAAEELRRAAGDEWQHSLLIRNEGLAVQAYGDFKAGDTAGGIAALRLAVAAARQGDVRSPPFYDRRGLAWLCATALAAGFEPAPLHEMIRRFRLAPPVEAGASWPWPLTIRTLGGFEVLRAGEPLRLEGDVQKKPVEMLKAIIAFGGRDVPETRVLDALWPELDGASARAAGKTALHRLRQWLGGEGLLTLKHGRLSLAEGQCWVDALAFSVPVPEGGEAAVLGLYRGPFLPDDLFPGWSAAMRERLRHLYLRRLGVAAKALAGHGHLAEAAEMYQQAVDTDMLDEDTYRGLMSVYGQMGRRDRVAQTFQRCRTALQAGLGIEPSPELMKLHIQLMAGG